MHGCKKCSTITSALILLAGLGFLLQDLKAWEFLNLSWYTVLFIIAGVTCLAKGSCKDCQAAAKGK